MASWLGKEGGRGRKDTRSQRGERRGRLFFIKILGWESTITMYIYMVIVDPRIVCKFKESNGSCFFVFFFL